MGNLSSVWSIRSTLRRNHKILKPINLKLGKEKVDAAKQMYKNIDSGMRGLKEIRILSRENFFTEKLAIFGSKIYRTQKISSLIHKL